MIKLNSLLVALCVGLFSTAVMADDTGNMPGYVGSPNGTGSGTVIKTQYGCLHNGKYKAEYGRSECDEAPNSASSKTVLKKANFTESNTQLFEFNQPTLSPAGKTNLLMFLDVVKKAGYIDHIDITGHTDKVGGDAYNQRLSTERANAIKEFFVSNGIEDDTITAEGMGPDESIVSDNCFKQYGAEGLAEVNQASAKDYQAGTKEREKMDKALAKYAKKHKDVVACAAEDRRVEISVELSKDIENNTTK